MIVPPGTHTFRDVRIELIQRLEVDVYEHSLLFAVTFLVHLVTVLGSSQNPLSGQKRSDSISPMYSQTHYSHQVTVTLFLVSRHPGDKAALTLICSSSVSQISLGI